MVYVKYQTPLGTFTLKVQAGNVFLLVGVAVINLTMNDRCPPVVTA